MRKETIQTLRKKGWTEDKIKEAESIIKERDVRDKSASKPHINKLMYWSFMVIAIVGNFMIALVMIPFLLVLNKLYLNSVIIIIGFVFGLLFNSMVIEIENIPRKHHIIAGVIIPLTAFFNMFLMAWIANWISSNMNISFVNENPIVASIFYAVAFIAPFAYSIFISKKIKIAYEHKGYYSGQEKAVEQETIRKF